MKKTIFVAGGDLRQIYAAKSLNPYFDVYITGFDRSITIPEKIKRADTLDVLPGRADFLLLPTPVSTDGTLLNTPYGNTNIPLQKLVSIIKEKGVVFGGKADNKIKSLFESSEIEFIDYLEREEFSVLNSVLTAEGALQIALEEMPVTIYGSKILITGYGRISKILSKILLSIGADVTVAARKCSDLTWADISGCHTAKISSLISISNQYDVIFNTVPAILFNKKIISNIQKDCLIIDLASRPGGIDFEAASEAGLKVVWALGIPGKSAPVSAGKIIADTILNIMTERGLTYE